MKKRVGDADLPGIAHLAVGGHDGRIDHVHIVADDDRGMAAQLHQHRVSVLGCQRRQVPPTAVEPVNATSRT